jgi:predicted metal-dependent phosphotriesterase family hydrolase
MSQIMTVRAPVDSGELGFTLMQEHLIRWYRRIERQCLKEVCLCQPMPNC